MKLITLTDGARQAGITVPEARCLIEDFGDRIPHEPGRYPRPLRLHVEAVYVFRELVASGLLRVSMARLKKELAGGKRPAIKVGLAVVPVTWAAAETIRQKNSGRVRLTPNRGLHNDLLLIEPWSAEA